MESEKAKWDYRGRVWEGFLGLWARLARKAKWGRAGRGRASRVKRNRIGRDVDGRAGAGLSSVRWPTPASMVLKLSSPAFFSASASLLAPTAPIHFC